MTTALEALRALPRYDDVYADYDTTMQLRDDGDYILFADTIAALQASQPVDAEPPTSIPAGYALVPIEPTPEMIAAADNLPESFSIGDEWRAMIAVAQPDKEAP